ncbi:MAG TPA: hypothetical protein VIU46_03020 [Gallionellaceae bacterium]
MKKLLKKILAEVAAGLGQALVLASSRSYVLPSPQAFRKDAAALRHDAKSIGDDLNEQFRQ